MSQRNGPDTGAPNARHDHNCTGDEDALRRTVDHTEVKSMCVVGFPGREEHGQAWAQRGEDTSGRATQAHGGCFEKTGQRAVERVNTVVEEFTESARGSGSSSLLSVEVIHCLVCEETERKAEVKP